MDRNEKKKLSTGTYPETESIMTWSPSPNKHLCEVFSPVKFHLPMRLFGKETPPLHTENAGRGKNAKNR